MVRVRRNLIVSAVGLAVMVLFLAGCAKAEKQAAAPAPS
jgi:hypothetical protein